MATVEEGLDSFPEDADGDEFDELESLSERGRFWNPRKAENNHPHKLVLRALRWESVPSKYKTEERNVIVATAKDGTAWRIPCDNLDLEPLWSGEVKQWNNDSKAFEVVDNWGRLRADEIFAVEYLGDRSFTARNGQFVTTGSFRVTRKPPVVVADVEHDPLDPGPAEPNTDLDEEVSIDDDIPY